MGLISLTWVFCYNLVKIHKVVIELLSFLCSVLFLVMADGDHLAMPNCKSSKIIPLRDFPVSYFSTFL